MKSIFVRDIPKRRWTQKGTCQQKQSGVPRRQESCGLPVSMQHWKRQGWIPPGTSRESMASQCFDFGLQVSRIMREYISVVVSHTVCGSLSQQPQKANTVGERS